MKSAQSGWVTDIIVSDDDDNEDTTPGIEDSDIEDETGIAQLRDRNQLYLISAMKNPAKWKVKTHGLGNGDEIQIITKPAASRMSYKLLHPSFYCDVNDLGDLDNLATFVSAPTDWKQTYDRIVAKSDRIGRV